uniref:Endonuclease_NS domain-containing protein n=1 Tax=Mesocestoides corti TaxID=53468 RepID=A0A5K3FV68_MESCO
MVIVTFVLVENPAVRNAVCVCARAYLSFPTSDRPFQRGQMCVEGKKEIRVLYITVTALQSITDAPNLTNKSVASVGGLFVFTPSESKTVKIDRSKTYIDIGFFGNRSKSIPFMPVAQDYPTNTPQFTSFPNNWRTIKPVVEEPAVTQLVQINQM